MTDFVVISTKGTGPLHASFAKVSGEAPKGLRIALNGVADIVVKGAVPLVPRRSGAAAKSIKAKSTGKAVKVFAGGPSAPYFAWLDFGGRVGRKKSVARTFYRGGRYIYPTIAKHQGDIEKALDAALQGVLKSSGLDVQS